MNYLLDTSTFLWSIFASKKLSQQARQILIDKQNSIFVSALTFWEISLKYSLNKLDLPGITPDKLIDAAKQIEYITIPLDSTMASSVYMLPRLHKDPFDRMLVWQAIQSKYPLISKDKEMGKYKTYGLSVSW